jgi:hypothetical protein
MGLLYDGYQMPPRETLGDTDVSQWEMGLDGQPADPWVHAIYLVLQRVDNSELFTFVAMSKTSRRAVGTLLRHYDRMQRTHPGYLPIVRLKVGGYQHRDPRVGWVKTPVIAAMGQVPGENAVKPKPADFGDEVPFCTHPCPSAAPAARKAAGGLEERGGGHGAGACPAAVPLLRGQCRAASCERAWAHDVAQTAACHGQGAYVSPGTRHLAGILVPGRPAPSG